MLYEYNLIRKKVSDDEVKPITGSRNVIDYAKKYLFSECEMWREKCWAVYLNRAKVPTGHFLVSVGSGSCCLIDCKSVIETALMTHSDCVVIVHNHPSGTPKPSQTDIRQTEALRKALCIFDMQLLDHVILGEDSYFSFCEEVTMHI